MIVAVAMLAGAFAGCLQEETKQGPATVSRVHTIFIDRETAEKLEDLVEDDARAALRELLDTKLVVRVETAGEYTVEYVTEAGATTSKSSLILPGVPLEIPGADPVAPVSVKLLTETVAVRAGKPGQWFHAGDIPLGFNMTPGTKAAYDFSTSLTETITVRDLNVDNEEVNMQVGSFKLDLNVPLRGTGTWEYGQDTGEGNPLKITGSVGLAPRDDLITVEADVVMNGEAGNAGAVLGVAKAEADGAATIWWENGDPAGGQLNGGSLTFQPVVSMWATGFFEALAEQSGCAGASRADRCTPEGVEDFEFDQEEIPRDDIDSSDLPRLSMIEDPEDRKSAEEALSVLQSLLHVDIVTGDRIELIIEVEEDDIDPYDYQPGKTNGRFEFSLEAVGVEDVTVPAGTFPSLKLVELMRIKFDVADIPHPTDPTKMGLRAFAVDEVITRTTFWLDTKTNVPVKMQAEMPFNIDATLKRLMDAIDPSLWDELGGKPIENNQWSIVVTSDATYALKEYDPATHFSPLTGLVAAHGLGSVFVGLPLVAAMSDAMGGLMPFGGPHYGSGHMDYRYAEPYPYEPDGSWHTDPSWTAPTPSYYNWDEPTGEPASVNLAQDPRSTGGPATFRFTDVMGELAWWDLVVLVDEKELYASYSCGAPGANETDVFYVCSKGSPPSFDATVEAGDTITFVAKPGASVVLMDGRWSAWLYEATVA